MNEDFSDLQTQKLYHPHISRNHFWEKKKHSSQRIQAKLINTF